MDLLERRFQCIIFGSVRAQYGFDYTFQKLSSGAVGMEDADRGDGHGQAGVVVNQLGQSLLRPLVLGIVPRIQVVFRLLVVRSAFQLFEDLRARLAFWTANPSPLWDWVARR